jgi:tetratricopeptide (TPR) repeat protein
MEMVAVNVIARQSQGELVPALEAPEGPTELSPKNARYLAAFWENITINPDYMDAHRQLGLSLRGMRRSPDTIARIYYNLGCALENRGEHALAIDAFRKAIESKPDYADAHYNLGCNLLEIDQPALAEPAFRRAIDIKSDYVKAHVNLGWSLIEMGRLPAAVAALRRAIKIKSDSARAYSALGTALYRAGRPKISSVVLRKALEIEPDRFWSQLYLGQALAETKQFDEALATHSRLIELFPNDANLHFDYAEIFLSAGRFDEALSTLDYTMAALHADDARVHLLRGKALLELNRPGDAVVAFDNAIQRDDDSEDAHSWRLKAMLDHASASYGGLFNNPKEMLGLLDQVIDNPEDGFRLVEETKEKYNIGTANNAESEANSAPARLSQSTLVYPDALGQKDGPALWLHESAHSLFLANCFDASITAAERAITLDKNFAAAHVVHAAALNKIGRHEEAIEACNRALAINPNYSYAHANHAEALYELHREEEALAPGIRAITIDPEYAYGHEILGLVYLRLKRYAEAMSATATANRLGGNAGTYAYHAAARMGFLSSLSPGPEATIAIADLDEVIADCDRSIELWNGDYWFPHYIRSQALLEASRFDAAIDDADRIIKMMPNSAGSHSLRGKILVGAGRFNEAVEAFDRALEIDPNHEEAIRGRSDALKKTLALQPANNDTLANQINREYDNTPANTGILSRETDANLGGATMNTTTAFKLLARTYNVSEAWLKKTLEQKQTGVSAALEDPLLSEMIRKHALSPQQTEAVLEDQTLARLLLTYDERLKDTPLPLGGYGSNEEAKLGGQLVSTFNNLNKGMRKHGVEPLEGDERVTQAGNMSKAFYWREQQKKAGRAPVSRKRGPNGATAG